MKRVEVYYYTMRSICLISSLYFFCNLKGDNKMEKEVTVKIKFNKIAVVIALCIGYVVGYSKNVTM